MCIFCCYQEVFGMETNKIFEPGLYSWKIRVFISVCCKNLVTSPFDSSNMFTENKKKLQNSVQIPPKLHFCFVVFLVSLASTFVFV